MTVLALSAGSLRGLAKPAGWLVATVLVTVLLAPFFSRRDFLDPAQPELTADIAPPFVAPASRLATPIRIPIASLVAKMEAAVPTSHGDASEPVASDSSRTDIALRFERGPFHVEMEADVVTLRTTVSYALRASYDPPLLPDVNGSCGTDDGEPMPRLLVTLRAPIAVDENWQLRTDTRVMEVRPASDAERDQCHMTFLGIDVTERVAEAGFKFLAEHTYQIDSIAASVDVRSSFEGWWRTLQEPIWLTDSLWLAMRPESVRQGTVRATGDSLDINVALRARPTMVYGPRPSFPDVPLPALDTGDVPEGLDLLVDARIEYEAASALLFEMLGGREFEYGGRTFTVETLRVFGIGGGRLAVESVLAGDVSARLFLVGIPEVDPATGQITVPDLEFDVSTRDAVLAAASWFRADDFRDVLRQEARWPAAPAVEWLSGWLVEGLNRELSDNLRVEGEVAEVRVRSVHAMLEVLLVRVSARGSARLFVDENPRP